VQVLALAEPLAWVQGPVAACTRARVQAMVQGLSSFVEVR